MHDFLLCHARDAVCTNSDAVSLLPCCSDRFLIGRGEQIEFLLARGIEQFSKHRPDCDALSVLWNRQLRVLNDIFPDKLLQHLDLASGIRIYADDCRGTSPRAEA